MRAPLRGVMLLRVISILLIAAFVMSGVSWWIRPKKVPEIGSTRIVPSIQTGASAEALVAC
jgi:uncharacterized membrane protein